MGVRVLYDPEVEQAALYDSVTDTAFGPLFEDRETAEEFLRWARDNGKGDPRVLDDPALQRAVNAFYDEREMS